MGSNLEINNGNYRGDIKNNLKGSTDIFMWKIKFPSSMNISKYNEYDFNIVDCNNNIFECRVDKNNSENSIAIIPKQNYAKNKYYYLNINYHRNNNSKIYVAFRLVNKKFENISFKSQTEYEDFIEKDKKNFWEVTINVSNTIKNNNIYENYKLDFLKFKYNIIPILIFVIISVILFNMTDEVITFSEFISTQIVLLFFCSLIQSIVFLIQRRFHKCVIAYNEGVVAFNKHNYSKALECFRRSQYFNKDNSYTIEAIRITEIILNL